MRPDEIAAAAVRNATARRNQINRLQPKIAESITRVNEIRKGKDVVKDMRVSIKFMDDTKHIPNFFPTPQWLVMKMLDLADIRPGTSVLEPSAGKGDIADRAKDRGAIVTCIELTFKLADHLRQKGHMILQSDFLEVITYDSSKFDRVLMNPPFERGTDEDHVLHAFRFVKPGGRLIAVVCNTTGRKLTDWAEANDGYVEDLPDHTFKNSERPTGVRTCLLVANKA